MVQPGDVCIIIAYCWIDQDKALDFEPKVVFCDENNRIVEMATSETHGDIK